MAEKSKTIKTIICICICLSLVVTAIGIGVPIYALSNTEKSYEQLSKQKVAFSNSGEYNISFKEGDMLKVEEDGSLKETREDLPVDFGSITKEEAYNHPKKNMLTKALGCTAYVEPDVMVKGFLKDDVLLMCSDGLTNMLRDDEISEIIKKNPKEACKTLVKRANELGGYDNITAVIIL